MGESCSFGFDDLLATPDATQAELQPAGPLAELNEWVDEQASDNKSTGAVYYDIETGPRPDDELCKLFRQQTLDEFASTCDKRWKPETVAAKYEEYKLDAWDKFVEKAALSPVTGRVLLIGVMRDEEFIPLDHESELENILNFWSVVEQALAEKTPIIGHNSNSFDLQFLVRRSWFLGVQVPREVRQGRYWHPLFRDTMEFWNCGNRDYVKLNFLGEFFRVGQKTEGVNGGDFHKLWFGKLDGAGTADEQRAKALEYNEQDLRLTAAIAFKMGMV